MLVSLTLLQMEEKPLGFSTCFAIVHNYRKPTDETEAPERWSDLSELCSASSKPLDPKSCVLCTQPYFPIKLTAFGRKTAAKPSWRVKVYDHPVSIALKKTLSLASSQNYSNWPDASFLMLSLLCISCSEFAENPHNLLSMPIPQQLCFVSGSW